MSDKFLNQLWEQGKLSTSALFIRVFVGPEKAEAVLPDRSNLVEIPGAVYCALHSELGKVDYAHFKGADEASLHAAWAPYIPPGACGILISHSSGEVYTEGAHRFGVTSDGVGCVYNFNRLVAPPKMEA